MAPNDWTDRATLVPWVKELLADRKARSALLQGQSRRVVYAASAQPRSTRAASSSRPRTKPPPAGGTAACPTCGAPATTATVEQRTQGHAVADKHPDGTRCEQPIPHARPPLPAGTNAELGSPAETRSLHAN